MTAATDLPERALRFEYPDDFDPAWSPRRPEFACAANAVSLIMPYAEPYFVRSVRAVLPELEGDARTTAQQYLRQELQHHVQHRRFNQLVDQRYPRLVRVEGWMRRTYGWLSRTRSTRFSLAFAAGSEAIAFTLARWTEQHLGDLFADADPVPSTLYLWHLAEEVEHKSAAFDVYEQLDGSRRRYAFAMVLSFVILAWFTTIGALTMLFADGRGFHPVSYLRLLRWGLSFAWIGLPSLLVSALPGHHPSDFADPIWLSSWLGHFDADAGTLPMPTFVGSADPMRSR
jgi:predicted metal-dependent hydrolase